MPPFQPASQERVSFNVEWFDPESELTRDMIMYYYIDDGSVELFDRRTDRTFLKRTQLSTVRCKDLMLGNMVTILGRTMRIAEYANDRTRIWFEEDSEATFALVKPATVQYLGKIMQIIECEGMRIKKARMVQLERHEADKFFRELQHHCQTAEMLAFLTAGPCVAMKLTGRDAVERWRRLMGPTDCLTAGEECSDTIQRQFGADQSNHCVHGSTGCEVARQELEFFFPVSGVPRPQTSARFSENGTCCVVLPHILADNKLGDVIAAIQECGSLSITAMDIMTLTKPDAEHVVEVYRGVLPEYPKMLAEMCSGPLAALELTGDDEAGHCAVELLRGLAGPRDPSLARLLRPGTLRAKFGKDLIRNAVYVTDLEEDSRKDREYFFRLLQPC